MRMSRNCGSCYEVVLLLLWLLLLSFLLAVNAEEVTCVNDKDCQDGAFCDENAKCIVKNPYQQGCLRHELGIRYAQRVCNSDDDDDASSCRAPPLPYPEIRIASLSWESAMFEAWLLQILLSELLGVPTSIETATNGASRLNFYDPHATFDYGTDNIWEGMELAVNLPGGDCSLRQQQNQSCVHVAAEVWPALSGKVQELQEQGIVQESQALGALFQESLFMSRLTIDEDVSLLTYFGLHGDENRRKLADTFLRPTSWKDYCEQVSADNCTTPDAVARHGPVDESDDLRYFMDGVYTGHFRKTEKNDCDKHPTTCTGHIMNYPCAWTSFMSVQLHWLKIALESDGDQADGGYTYSQMVDIWHAANATQSNLISIWWRPDALYQKLADTPAAMTHVRLPDSSYECMQAKLERPDRCGEDFAPFQYSPLATCDSPPMMVQKVLGRGFYDSVYNNPAIPYALQSPAYEAVSLFHFSELQINGILRYWQAMGDPRQAVCQWAAENVEFLKEFIPPSYPRTILQAEDDTAAMAYATLGLGGAAICLVLVSALLLWACRREQGFWLRRVQVEVLCMFLLGFFLVSVGSLLSGLHPTDAACGATAWLVNFGYAPLLLVPCMIQIAGYNRLARTPPSGKRRPKQFRVRIKFLFASIGVMMLVVVAYLVAWQIVDPARVQTAFELLDVTDDSGATVVKAHKYCGSANSAWPLAGAVWNALLLAFAAALAFEVVRNNHGIKRKKKYRGIGCYFKEARLLAWLITSLSIFAVARLVLMLLAAGANAHSARSVHFWRAVSLTYSLDVIVGVCVYYLRAFCGPPDAPATGGTIGASRSERYQDDKEDGDHTESRSDRKGKRASPHQESKSDSSLQGEDRVAALDASINSARSKASSRQWRRRQSDEDILFGSGENVLGQDDTTNDELLKDFEITSTKVERGGKEHHLHGEHDTRLAERHGPSNQQQHVFRNITVPTRLGVSVESTNAGLKVCEVDPNSDFYGHVSKGDFVVGFGGLDTTAMPAEELVQLLQNYKTLTVIPSSLVEPSSTTTTTPLISPSQPTATPESEGSAPSLGETRD